jgi:hypothetical protein
VITRLDVAIEITLYKESSASRKGVGVGHWRRFRAYAFGQACHLLIMCARDAVSRSRALS